MNKRKTMNPARFVLGERVRYINHVTGEHLGQMEIIEVDGNYVIASRIFDHNVKFKFRGDGRATWSSNLSISKHAGGTPALPGKYPEHKPNAALLHERTTAAQHNKYPRGRNA